MILLAKIICCLSWRQVRPMPPSFVLVQSQFNGVSLGMWIAFLPFSTFTQGGGPLGLPKVDCVTSSTIGTKVPEPQSATLEDIRRNRNKARSYKIGRGDMVTRGDRQEVLIWTDGSKIHTRAGYGVDLGRNSNLNMAGRTLGDQMSDNSELQAMLRDLELSADLPSIHVITDNEPACNLVNKLLLRPRAEGMTSKMIIRPSALTSSVTLKRSKPHIAMTKGG